jgi:hypothetical protein
VRGIEESIRVLVVDDDADALVEQLAALGLRCEVVAGAADALSVLDWWTPIAVVIDGTGRAGLASTIRAWANERYRPMLIVAYSHAAPAAGEDHDLYVEKPHVALVLAAITKFLGYA